MSVFRSEWVVGITGIGTQVIEYLHSHLGVNGISGEVVQIVCRLYGLELEVIRLGLLNKEQWNDVINDGMYDLYRHPQ